MPRPKLCRSHLSTYETRALSALLARARPTETWLVLDAATSPATPTSTVEVGRHGTKVNASPESPRLLIAPYDALNLLLLAYPAVEAPTKRCRTVSVIVDAQVSDAQITDLLTPGPDRTSRYPVLIRSDALPGLASHPNLRVIGAATTLFEALAPADVVITATAELARFANAMLKPAMLLGSLDHPQDQTPFTLTTTAGEVAATLDELEPDRLAADLFNWKREVFAQLPGQLNAELERLGV